MQAPRLVAVLAAAGAAVLGVSLLLDGVASGPGTAHTCSPTDRQLIQAVGSNMAQLGFWSDSLLGGQATPAEVEVQARAEADQIESTRPTDPTLAAARSLLVSLFVQYARAVHARAHGGDAGVHMRLAYTLANETHDLLAAARLPLARLGCDVSPLI